MDITENVKLYHELGLNQDEVLCYLAAVDKVIISKRSLKRILKKAKLFRRKSYSDILDVSLFLLNEVQNAGQLHGYKLMHLKCIQNGYVVTQETVRQLLHVLDPIGVSNRRRGRLKRRQYSNPGPNFMWHMDSYDKLKPYGICINGCVDGFSRHVIWLEAYRTSSNPAVIGSYFVNAVENRQGVPMRVRADRGTENGYVEQMLVFMRSDNADEFARIPFIYGSSNHNQRIESWWGQLRQHSSEFWIKLFHSLKEEGKYLGDHLDKSLVQFCFMQIIQEELDEFSKLWNTHRIRRSNHHSAPSGRPLTMYNLPHLYGTEDFLCPISSDKIQLCKEECEPKDQYSCDRDVHELCSILMQENNLSEPCDSASALDLYNSLRATIYQIL